jgi:predicted negative regulator of RcsB-dependent stress response
MDLSELITGFLAVLVLSILGIDALIGWRSFERKAVPVGSAAAPVRHSFDSKISCDIVWC